MYINNTCKSYINQDFAETGILGTVSGVLLWLTHRLSGNLALQFSTFYTVVSSKIL